MSNRIEDNSQRLGRWVPAYQVDPDLNLSGRKCLRADGSEDVYMPDEETEKSLITHWYFPRLPKQGSEREGTA